MCLFVEIQVMRDDERWWKMMGNENGGRVMDVQDTEVKVWILQGYHVCGVRLDMYRCLVLCIVV